MAAPPPAKRDQNRKGAKEPKKRDGAAGCERIARIFRPRGWRRFRNAREIINQRQYLAGAGRTADVGSSAVGVLNFTVGLVARTRGRIVPNARETYGDARHCPFELRQDIAL